MGRMRCWSRSKSIRTGLAGVSGTAAPAVSPLPAPAPPRPPRPPPDAAGRGAPSSSLSGASGEGILLGSTARYTLLFTSCSSLVMSRPLIVGPALVLAVKYRYWQIGRAHV